MAGFAFEVPGKPAPKGRPRSGRGRTYTPAATVRAEELVRQSWIVAGRPYVPGAFAAELEFVFARPRRSEALVPAGDVDNLAKLVLDALNGFAFDDDRLLVDLRVRKSWGDAPRSVVTVRPAALPLLRVA